MIDPRLLKDVQVAESCRLIAYKDTKGYWTIGWGHKLEEGIDWTGHEITQETADALLQQDLGYAAETSEHLTEWPFLNTICRQNAIVELVFNMGPTTWRGFAHCRLFLTQNQWPEAADELLDSLWARQVGKTRSERLAGYIRDGQYPV